MVKTKVVQKTLKDIIKEEWKRCSIDPAYFMRKYCKIQHPIRGKIPFSLYDFQESSIDEFIHNRFNIILKARQLGLSTLVAMYILWLIIFKKDQNVLVIATQKDIAKNLITKIRYANDNLPTWLRLEALEDNKMSLLLKNNSMVRAVSSSASAVVSYALSLLVIDEAAHIERMEDIWTAAQPTLSTGGNCIVLSTPKGQGNWFYDMWLGADSGENGFNTLKLPWSVHPERDQKWRDSETKRLGKRSAAQEHDCDFKSSGNTVIDLHILDYYDETFCEEPKEKNGVDKGLWIWEYPIPNKTYVVSGDVARGDGSDYSACHVFEIESLTQVAEYKGMIDTRQYGRLMAALGTQYNNALVVVERENVGWDTVQELININYPNLFYSSNDLQYVDSGKQYTNKLRTQDKQLKPGWGTTTKSRPLIINKLELYFEERSVIIKSKRTINELRTFIWKNGKAQAQSGKNDDLTIALGILLWIRDTALKLQTENINLINSTLSGITRKSNVPIYKSGLMKENPYQMNIGSEVVDLNEFL